MKKKIYIAGCGGMLGEAFPSIAKHPQTHIAKVRDATDFQTLSLKLALEGAQTFSVFVITTGITGKLAARG